MTRCHRIQRTELDSLATNADDASVVRTLRGSQHSRRLLLLRAILDRATDRSTGLDEAFRLLSRTQETAPAIVQEVLLHPPVGIWAASTLRRMTAGADHSGSVATDLRHLAAIAASAALQAGQDFELSVPVHRSRVFLPMLGGVGIPETGGAQPDVALRHRQPRTTISWGSHELALPTDLSHAAPGWTPLPRLVARANGQPLTAILDDADPYRHYPGLSPANELSGAALDRWGVCFDEAWALLAEHHPRLARTVAAVLTCIVPLEATGPARASGTSSDAFGAAAVSLPETGVDLAVTMVHEVQHSKLGALLDVLPLCQGHSDQLLYAPWRDDPRPVGGLLHGCYAYFGITDFWRAQRHVATGREAGVADFEFARWREQAWKTCSLLARSGALTAAGRRFVAGMRHALVHWRSEPVSLESRSAARLAALDHEVTWRLRNLRPDETVVAELGRAWRAGLPCPVDRPVPSEVLPGLFSPADDTRVRLLRHRLREPAAALVAEAEPGDKSLMRGDYCTAAEAYRAEIERSGPAQLGVWAGLALACSISDPSAANQALWKRPEIVVAVYREVLATSGTAPDPERLARWLAPATG